MPHAALTALQAFALAGAPWSSSPDVLVLGGSGGVGHLAIQLARSLGARSVTTTCSPRNFELVGSLGADRAIDYHTADWWSQLGKESVDVILDTVGVAGTGDHALEVLRKEGWFVTLLGGAAMAQGAGAASVHQAWCRVSHTGTQYLDTLRAYVDAGQLHVTIDSQYGLGEVQEALARSEAGHAAGKIAIVVAGGA